MLAHFCLFKICFANVFNVPKNMFRLFVTCFSTKNIKQTKKLISNIRKTLGIAKGIRNPMFGKKHSIETKNKMKKLHKSTGPKYRLSCLTCKKETTVNAFWRHNECKGLVA